MNLQLDLHCSICLESFCCPVTTDCGHSFCSACITQHWDREPKAYTCPDCRKTFSSRPQLAKSISLSRISEALQAGEGAVSGNLCEAHGKSLEFYCRSERMAICSLCAIREHKTHDTVTLEEEAEQTREPIVKRQRKVELQLQETLGEIRAWKERDVSLQASLQRIRREVDREFNELSGVLEKAKGEVGGFLQRAERETLTQSGAAVTQLEQHVADLRQEELELQTLLESGDHLELVKGSQTLRMTPDCPRCLAVQSEVPVQLTDLSRATAELSDLLREQLEVFTQMNVPGSPVADGEDRQTQAPENQSSPHIIPTPDPTALSDSPQGAGILTPSMPRPLQEGRTVTEPQTRLELLHYLTTVTFDPNTASDKLLLSEDGRGATSSLPSLQLYPHHLDRFDRLSQVLGEQEFTVGRHYWEMHIRGSSVLVGLAHRNMGRKGRGTSCFLGRNQASWCLELAEGTGTPWHNNQVGKPVPVQCQCLGLYLDFAGSALTFYSITDRAAVLHRFQAPFTGPLLPAFQIGKGASIRIGN